MFLKALHALPLALVFGPPLPLAWRAGAFGMSVLGQLLGEVVVLLVVAVVTVLVHVATLVLAWPLTFPMTGLTPMLKTRFNKSTYNVKINKRPLKFTVKVAVVFPYPFLPQNTELK